MLQSLLQFAYPSVLSKPQTERLSKSRPYVTSLDLPGKGCMRLLAKSADVYAYGEGKAGENRLITQIEDRYRGRWGGVPPKGLPFPWLRLLSS